MNATIHELLESALQLPEKDRADLAASLIESLDQSFDADAQTAWGEEVCQRLADLDSGMIKTVPWDQTRAVTARSP